MIIYKVMSLLLVVFVAARGEATLGLPLHPLIIFPSSFRTVAFFILEQSLSILLATPEFTAVRRALLVVVFRFAERSEAATKEPKVIHKPRACWLDFWFFVVFNRCIALASSFQVSNDGLSLRVV